MGEDTVISVEERKKQIEARESLAKKVSDEEAKRREAAALFDIKEFIADASRVRETYVKEIDRRIQYKKLTVAENAELSKIVDREKRGVKMLYLMLRKANLSIVEDQVEQLGSDVAAVVLAAILEDQGFLLSG